MRKICVAVLSRANYGRVKSVMRAISEHPDLVLQVLTGASANLDRFGNVANIIEQDGFSIDAKLDFAVEGDSPSVMAKTTGLGIIEISSALDHLQPDIVVTVADRYETMATAIVASYQNILLAHIQGGEVTGSIDESVRHAITKLSHIHFPCTHKAARNIIKMGEDPNFVFNVGCPAMDAFSMREAKEIQLSQLTGTGYRFMSEEAFNLVSYHPVTTNHTNAGLETQELLTAIENMQLPAIWLWPNIDAGTDRISKVLRVWRDNNPNGKIRFIKNLPVNQYNQILKKANVLIGNSSSFIREGSYIGAKAILVGDRQNNREIGENILISKPKCDDILNKYHDFKNKKIKPSQLYGRGNAGEQIALYLAGHIPLVQKILNYD